jgi:hypothetical protein
VTAIGVREHKMTSEEARTPTATAGEEQKDDGTRRMPDGIQHKLRLPLPGVGMPVAMPTGLPGRALWWGGLAALAAFDVVEWPVAVIVGAGEWVAEQYAKSTAQRPGAESRSATSSAPSAT